MEKNGHNENTYYVNIRPQTTRTTRWVVFVFLLISVFTIGYGFSSFRGGISLFEEDNTKSFWSRVFRATADEQEVVPMATENKLNVDTDGDGLSDIEETNIYGTSPYLADTDSDGVSDKEEIDAGENPICAKGQDCSITKISENIVSKDDDKVASEILNQNEALDLNDPAELRQR